MRLSIVIPVWNKYNFTSACLKDLSLLPEDNEIIVVDNGSTDKTEELSKNTRIKYHRLEQNVGFARGCNIGYGLSSSDNVLFLNNDIRVQKDHSTWTDTLIDKCSLGLVGPTMGQLDDQYSFVRESNKYIPGDFTYMSGWCLASSKTVWEKLRLTREDSVPQIFSEEFGLAYFEDTDLSFRAREQGIPFEMVSIPVVHFGKQTSQQLNTGHLYTKAKSIFVRKWGKNDSSSKERSNT